VNLDEKRRAVSVLIEIADYMERRKNEEQFAFDARYSASGD
jgi:hypothetical protein